MRLKDVNYWTKIDYWDKFYQNYNSKDLKCRKSASPFAKWIAPLIRKTDIIADLGCGTMGDSLYFSNIANYVFAVDMSRSVFKIQNRVPSNVEIIKSDLIDFCDIFYSIDIYYLRFVLHCFDIREQSDIINKISKNAKPGAFLMIEARTINDSIYQKGQPAGPNAFIDGHYRCFIDSCRLEEMIKNKYWDILFCQSSDGWSEFAGTNPNLVRLIARKRT